jgi:hypothetical protein
MYSFELCKGRAMPIGQMQGYPNIDVQKLFEAKDLEANK